MNEPLTLKQVEQALGELEMLLDTVGDDKQLAMFSALYAKAYCMKLRLMPKESKHASD